MESLDTTQFQAPIPGMSLTTEPGNRPWENPPTLTTPEEALNFYLKSLTAPSRSVELLGLLELGYPVTNLIDIITLGGVMEGKHSIDTGVVIAPALYELITGMADAVEIEYKDGVTDLERDVPKTMLAKAAREPEAEELARQMDEEDIRNFAEAAQSGGLMARPEEEEIVEELQT